MSTAGWTGLLLVVLPMISAGEETLRTIEAVRQLSPGRAEMALPVEVEVLVLKRSPSGLGMFVHDEQAGIYVSLHGPLITSVGAGQGDLVRITGVTEKGHFIPAIEAREVEVLGVRPPPKPLKMDRRLLLDPTLDCRWVELEGVVVDTVPTGLVFSLRLACYGEVINLVLPRSPKLETSAQELLNQAVRVRGVATTQWNARRQMTARTLQVNSMGDVEVLTDPDAALPLTGIDQLLRMETGSLESIRVRGVVTFSEGKLLCLQGPEGSLLVRLARETNLTPGGIVEAIGTVDVEPFSPALLAWNISPTGETAPLEIEEIALGDPPFPGSWHHSLVTLEAELVDVRRMEESLVLQCAADGHFFSATLGGVKPDSLPLEPGSVLALRGICVLRSSQARAHAYDPDGISLLLRVPDDVTVLQRPSWWTIRRIVITSAVAAVVALGSLAWVGMLRKRVADQTEVIRSQVEREVGMKERERLARHLHDSLEQNIAGLNRQLSTAEQKIENGKFEEIGDALFLARRMAVHCQRESRESIHDLRQNFWDGSSSQWHDELLLSEAESLGADVRFTTEGSTRARDGATNQKISKIVREAVYNALRHGRAKQVEVIRREGDDGLEVEIRDDGSGFDSSVPPARGHFGLHGMRERAHHMNGELTIESSPGEGAVVLLTIPN